jgi:F-type H+-transporting ATPase subunit a
MGKNIINNNFNSPLEQFEVYILKLITIAGYDFSITNVTITCISIAFILTLIFNLYIKSLYIIPTRSQFIIESIYFFIVDMIKQQLGFKGLIFFPIIFYIFIFILISNLYGLIPYGFVITGHIIITLYIALTFNISFLLRTIYLNHIYTYMLFIPKGISKALLPLIFIIELISYMLRTLSLSIRLFANMMAGHILLYTVSSFFISFITINYIFVSIFTFILILLISILELAICFIQAYVFALLITIYLNDTFTKFH